MMTLYLDMDGVIANFFDALAQKFEKNHWKEIGNIEKSILKLQGTDFFNTIEPYDNSLELVNFVEDLTEGDWGICSSPLRGDRDNSAYWKRRWLERHFILPDIDKLIFTGMKEKFAVNKLDGSPNILVDDKPTNIDRWVAKGGIGIRYQANEDSLSELKTTLKKVWKK